MEKKSFAKNFPNNRRVTPGLISFVEKNETTLHKGNALDLWFGVGQDSKYLAEQGYLVDAVDNDEIALQRAKQLNFHERVRFVQQNIQDFVFSKHYDLILAILSLFTLSKSSAETILRESILHLNTDGYMMVVLLGPKDDWSSRISTRTIAEIQQFLSFYPEIKIITLQESFEEKMTAAQEMKHWHFINIILQKTQ